MDSYFFILLVFILSCVIHFLFIYFLFNVSTSNSISSKTDESVEVKLTILICARNEAQNLENNIPLICGQGYPNLEVIVVNHKSTDNSQAVLSKLNQEYEILKVVNCLNDHVSLPGKRSAIYAGLAETTGQYVLLTDADCKPNSNQWAKYMVNRAETEKADLVIGIGAYEGQQSLLNRFIQFETFQTALLYLSTALIKWPYMAVGRNLLIKKDVLDERMKQSVVPGVLSGDDDLLIANLSFNYKVSVEINENARTQTSAKANWTSYVKQKMRHMSTSEYYRDQHRWILQLFHGSQVLILASFVILLFSRYFLLAVIMMICRCVLVMMKLSHEKDVLKMKSNLLLYPVMELISIVIPMLSMIAIRINKSNEWS